MQTRNGLKDIEKIYIYIYISIFYLTFLFIRDANPIGQLYLGGGGSCAAAAATSEDLPQI